MVVQHNLQAMNANRMLNITTGSQSKSAEKLSSGYRINRAADDAAGLSISEKMRKQIRGLDQASTNAEDGVSAVQTAEGALTEVHSMLQRMNELAVQASNGTNSQTDRDAIQSEIDQLTTEIDRVAETTKFNESYLLKGDSNGATKKMYLEAHDAGLKGITAMINFETTRSAKDNGDVMTDSLSTVKSGQLTYAVRDTSIDGKEIKKDNYLGLGDKGLAAVGTDMDTTLLEMIESMMSDEAELISVYYGADVEEAAAEAVVSKIEEKFPDVDVELQFGGQPVYYYIVSVE